MATRCPRCQKQDISLETFGVYRCPTCGRIDADGLLLDPAAPGVAAAAGAVETGRASFAAPPPSAWVPPGAPAPTPVAAPGSGPPIFFLAMVVLDALMTLGSAVSAGNVLCGILGLAFLAPLATGKPWARNVALVGAALEVLLIVVLFTAFRAYVPSDARATLGAELVIQALWVYALMRPETVRYFERGR